MRTRIWTGGRALAAAGGLALVLGFGPTSNLTVGTPAPAVTGRTWLNSPQGPADLKGKVALIEFWTFGCFNCRNVEPHVKEWQRKYAHQGLVIIGVHTPETDYERQLENVERYVREHDLRYAIAMDDDLATWNRFRNHAWPAMYLVDKRGIIRHVQVGEGGYEETERQIQTLLDS